MTKIEQVKAILTAKAAAHYSHLTPKKAADMIYAACKEASYVEELVGSSYEQDGGDAACKLIAAWIKADRII